MSEKGFVTRFAPSPTGSIHVGNTRSAIWNYLYARNKKGKLILRIEDTDLERSKREDEMELRRNLEWMGITFEEGNLDNPYRQSERLDIYKKYAYQLLEEGSAYQCFCSDELLEEKREKARLEKRPPVYDRTCYHLSQEEKEKKLAAGEKAAIRLIVPDEDIIFDDLIKGTVNMKKGMFGDFIILRSNDVAVYNFCVVVDDMLMGVNHIMRAQEHLTNAAKQILVYKALKAPVPVLAHTPLLLAPDGSKLSKRHGATSLQEYRAQGYLKEAIINYLATLGWTPPTTKEKLTIEELIEYFDPSRITKGSSKFDIQKFRWINSLYIKELSNDERNTMTLPYMEEAYDLSVYSKEEIEQILNICSGGLEYLAQITELTQIFFHFEADQENTWYTDPYYNIPKLLTEQFESISEWTKENIENSVKLVSKELSIKGKNLFLAIRFFTTGIDHGPAIYDVLYLLGKERLLSRLKEWLA